MSRFLITTCLLLIAASLAFAQAGLEGRVVDAEGRPVPYANVYFPAAETGAVTGADGRFGAAFAKTVGPFDTLVVSSVGFRDTALTVRSLRELGGAPLVLAKAAYELTGVEVSGARVEWGRRELIGERIRKPILSMCAWGVSDVGGEIVVAVANKGRRRLEAIALQPEMVPGDSVLVEINIYRLGPSGLPRERLQRAPIRTVLTNAHQRRNHVVDFADAPVIVDDGPFAIGIEPLAFYGGGRELDRGSRTDILLRTPCSDRRATQFRSFVREEDGRWREVAIGGSVFAYGRRGR